ncbi:MAG: M3 family oligoendopeptidase [Roseburia sp.]
MQSFKFSELEYVRPDFTAVGQFADDAKEAIEKAASYEELKRLMQEMEEKNNHLATMATIAFIRHTLDTRDAFYEKEDEYINHIMPTILPKFLALNEAILNSPFKADVEKEYGSQYFVNMELQKKTFCEENIPLMQQEAKLTNEYQKIMATAEIEFDGETRNLYGIQKYFEHEDRETRAAAVAAYSEFYHAHEARLEEIWSELIAIRNQMAKNLGYDNYIPVGYLKQGRTDYGQKEVEAFREQVRKVIVPLCTKLYEAQAKRLGVDALMFYDEKCVFLDGNATPAGDDDFMVEQARGMYHEISPETAAFIDFMIEHELMDLKNKPGKASTGYMTALADYKAPFVFSCFNQTIFDMQVLTHELGHAFAGYMAMREQPISEYYSESTDIAEIHSMAMEQFSYPYAERFFGNQADKFRFAHLQEALTFVPFGVAVDEFQHICYEKPELTPKQRTREWKKLEEKYMPWRKYDADDFFDRGGWWYHKLHIYLYPFYYINYTLTTIGAMEFKKKDKENHKKAWEDYLKLCKCGGSMSYLKTLAYANLSSPFAEGSVEKAVAVAKEELLSSIYMK